MEIRELQEWFRYEPETGKIFWVKQRGSHGMKGAEAGAFDIQTGYILITLGYRNYKAARVAWALHHGKCPTKFIDHKNGIRNDNRISNLREATKSQNSMNCKLYKTNTSGHKGVCKHYNKWKAYIHVNEQRRSLGVYKTIEEAAEVRNLWERLCYGEFRKEHV